MDVFFIDKLGDEADDEDDSCDEQKNSSDVKNEISDLFDEPLDNFQKKKKKLLKKNDVSLNNTYLVTSYKNLSGKMEKSFSNVDRMLERSAIRPGLEKEIVVPLEKGKKFLKKERKKLNKKTKGKQWFDMPATEVTKEVMTDFKLLKMRSVLDRKHVYKKNDITKVPKYFQIGKVIESPADFYGGRIPKSQRKKTFVDELLQDAEFQRYQKKKFKEIMDDSRRKNRNKKSLLGNKKEKNKPKFKRKTRK